MVARCAKGRDLNGLRRLRDLPGVLLKDVPRFERALAQSGQGHRGSPIGWISLGNRNEHLRRVEDDPGYVCDWKWGSDLHAALVLPMLGRRVMDRALQEWPIRFAERPPQRVGAVEVSFVIALEGEQRLPQLHRTLQSLFAQEGAACEYIVVDQSPLPLLSRIPEGVRYRHLVKEGLSPGWRKSWAFNVGARLANADIIVFHDGDICAPAEYARELVGAFARRRCGAASLQRMLFYLGPRDTARIDGLQPIPGGLSPETVFQNWKGGTIAIRKQSFFEIGGFDEGFVNWGGEDDEFFDRCEEVGHVRAGFLPFVHLWHPPQPQRMNSSNRNIQHVLPARLSRTRKERIEELSARRFGDFSVPDPASGYK